MLSTVLVNVVVGIVRAAEDWLTPNLDWDVLSLGIDTVISITGVIGGIVTFGCHLTKYSELFKSASSHG